MPRVKGVNYSKDERRELILQAGLVTFCRMGYDGANIDDIAKESKCSHGLIYYYFKNKEEIFRELVKLSGQIAENTVEALANPGAEDAVAQLKAVTDKLLVIIQTRKEVFYYFQFAMMLHMLKKDLSDMDIIPPKYLPYDGLREMFLRGQREGVLKQGNTDMYVNLYLSIIQGLTSRKAMCDAGSGQIFVLPTSDVIIDVFLNK